MARNRSAFIQTIIDGIEAIIPNSPNTQMYRDMFAAMSDEQIDAYYEQLKTRNVRLSIVAPPDAPYKLSVERNKKIAKEWGHDFYQRIYIDPGKGIPKYLTPIPYLIMMLPMKRQAQHLVKKISIPEDNKTIDDYSGQPTGASKGSKISYPEVQIMTALNLDNSLIEFMKFRGGDERGFDAMNASINRTGSVSIDELKTLGTRVTSTTTLYTILKAMHIDSEGLKQ